MTNTKKPKVLYVDDEPINTTMFQMNFRREFDVIICGSGEEGLKMLEKERDVDVILSDFKMPGLNGIEFIAKANYLFGQRPSLILSGYDRNEQIEAALDAGLIKAYLQKPMDRELVRKTIEQCCKQ